MTAQEAYCLQFLRLHAYELYFAVLFAPKDKRAALAALYAFQTEILRIGAQVKEPLLGEMRLQWWQDSLAAAYRAAGIGGTLPTPPQEGAAKAPNSQENSPIITALAAAAARYDLPLAPLSALCAAARFELYDDAMPHCAALAQYYQALYGAVLQLSCQIWDGAADKALAAAACRSGGMAQGLIALLRRLAPTMRQGKCGLPLDIIAGIGSSREALAGQSAAMREKAALPPNAAAPNIAALAPITGQRRRAVCALIAYFQEQYQAFAAAQKNLPAALRPAFLPLAVLPAYAKQAEKQQEGIFASPPALSHLAQQAKIVRAAVFKSF